MSEGAKDCLAFRVGGVWIAVPPEAVVEIAESGATTAVPRAPSYVDGFMSLKGVAVPRLDLGRFLGLDAGKAAREGPARRVVVVKAASMTVGLLADHVAGVVAAGRAEFGPVQVTRTPRLLEFATAEAQCDLGLVVAVDLPALLEAARLKA